MSYGYDPNYNRLASMTDGTGTTAYGYYPMTTGTLGAGRLASVAMPLANSTLGISYDELGRVIGRTINGSANSTTTAYDTLGRATSVINPLGTFGFGYVGATNRINVATYPNSQSTVLDYFDNIGDDRLKEIQNLDPSSSVISQFDYAYDAVGRITKWSAALRFKL